MTNTEEDLKLRQKQFRKDTKIYSEVFSLMCQEVAELEKEKSELLGIIQQKDELIKKLICCQNCKNYYNETKDGDDYCSFLHTCSNHDKWELAE